MWRKSIGKVWNFPRDRAGRWVMVNQLNSPCMLVLIFMLLENSWHPVKILHGTSNSRHFHFVLRGNGIQPDLLLYLAGAEAVFP